MDTKSIFGRLGTPELCSCRQAKGAKNVGKRKRRYYKYGLSGSKAGQIFRGVAQGLLNSKHIAIGAFMRRIKSKKDSRIAVKAGARKLAEAFYRLLTNGAAYVEKGTKDYMQQIKEKEKMFLEKLALKHNLKLVSV